MASALRFSIEALTEVHDVSSFCSGKPPLDSWLRTRALHNQQTGDSRTFVAVHRAPVLGFYSLTAASAARVGLPGALRRNAPDPVPLMLLAQLAVDQTCRGQGLGRALLRDGLARIGRVAAQIGFRAVATHPIDAEAESFYAHYQFVAVPGSKPRLMLLPRRLLLAAMAAESAGPSASPE